MHVVLANLLSEIIMVRDGFSSLPTWLSCDLTDDVISSVCVQAQCSLLLFLLFLLCLSVM